MDKLISNAIDDFARELKYVEFPDAHKKYEKAKQKLIPLIRQHIPEDRPKIVCLCGSTRFQDAFTKAQLEKTLAGKIVLTIGCNMKSDIEIFGHLSKEEFDTIKVSLDELHKWKIDLANEVLVLNVGGYIGDSTKSEIDYAVKLGKPVKYLEAIDLPNDREARELL